MALRKVPNGCFKQFGKKVGKTIKQGNPVSTSFCFLEEKRIIESGENAPYRKALRSKILKKDGLPNLPVIRLGYLLKV